MPEKWVTYTFKVGRIEDNKAWLGQREFEPQAIAGFLAMVNERSYNVLSPDLDNESFPVAMIDLRDIVGKTKRAFIQGQDIMIECLVNFAFATMPNLGFSFVVATGNSRQFKSVVSINYFVPSPAGGQITEIERTPGVQGSEQ